MKTKDNPPLTTCEWKIWHENHERGNSPLDGAPSLSLKLPHSNVTAWGKVNEIHNNDNGDHKREWTDCEVSPCEDLEPVQRGGPCAEGNGPIISPVKEIYPIRGVPGTKKMPLER